MATSLFIWANFAGRIVAGDQYIYYFPVNFLRMRKFPREEKKFYSQIKNFIS